MRACCQPRRAAAWAARWAAAWSSFFLSFFLSLSGFFLLGPSLSPGFFGLAFGPSASVGFFAGFAGFALAPGLPLHLP